MSQIKLLKTLKQRIKHLRGRHDQLDHAWNRGMGRGSGGGVGDVVTVEQYQAMSKKLDEEVAAGTKTQEVANGIRKNLQKKANDYYDAVTRASLGMARIPRRRRASAQLADIRANDIASAAQQGQLANQNSNLQQRISDFAGSVQGGFNNILNRIRDIRRPKNEIAQPIQQEQAPAERAMNFSYNMPDRSLENYPIFDDEMMNSIYNNPSLQTVEPLINGYVQWGMSELDAIYKVLGFAKKMDQKQLVQELMQKFEISLKQDKIDRRNEELLKPPRELIDSERVEISENVRKQFNLYMQEHENADSENVDDNIKTIALIYAIQSLSPIQQMNFAFDRTLQKEFADIIDYNEDYRSEKIINAVLIGGTPEARLYADAYSEQVSYAGRIFETRYISIEHLIRKAQTYGWQWFASEIMSTHMLQAVGWKTAMIQELLASISQNQSYSNPDRPGFYPVGVAAPAVNADALAALQKTYEQQQQVFKEKQITKELLYRATKLMLGLPMESWSSDRAVSETFLEKNPGAIMNEQEVPIENIFCRHDTLPGWPTGIYKEQESVVLGIAQAIMDLQLNQ